MYRCVVPELPEVEGFRATIEQHVVGRRIARARFLDDWMLKDTTPSTAARRLRGRKVSAVDRKGKMLALFTDAPVLVLHFGMTGRPVIARTGDRVHQWDRVVCDLDSGEQFRYRNSRRLGSVRVVTRTELADLTWKLGPDPLEAPPSYLHDVLDGRLAPIKAVLLDQAVLAGVGNIYADEALFRARLHPLSPAGSLRREHCVELRDAIVATLEAGLDNGGATIDDYRDARGLSGTMQDEFLVHRREGAPCPRCGAEIRRVVIAGRSTYFCPSCQRRLRRRRRGAR